ncbi:MAG: chemotaxis response regulator protein-glutamate methylesterase [Caulobacterales bacterium 32-69-10]|nr:MAG: chemotaxis response regulator protein-glutamate methylesterase [Caulobacterales bacterium 32-69-10]
MSKIRVLIVDDSPTMRVLIANILRRDPEIEVIGSADDPMQAREAIKALNPDVITLDVEMPKMNGIEFLERLMRLRPMPVVMVSTLTQAGADTSLRALELGAFDCVGKPSADSASSGFSELSDKVKAAARSKIRPLAHTPVSPPPGPFRPNGKIVAIGSSTGGVEALVGLIQRYPANCPPTVITQHMPGTFTRSFAERLNRLSAAQVSEAENGAPLQIGRVYVAPGGDRHLEVAGTGKAARCSLSSGDTVSGHRPSVDVLFQSVAATQGAQAVGVILTGMGRDGAQGLLAMRTAGARTIGQDEASCVVFGMPRAAADIGAVERQLPMHRIADEILSLAGATSKEPA